MSQLKKIKNRIKSVQNTNKITKAMELISVSKLKKSQANSLLLENFFTFLSTYISILQKKENKENLDVVSLPEASPKKVIAIIFTSNKGLCGTFNTKTLKEFSLFEQEKIEQGYTVEIICIGNYGRDFILKGGRKIKASAPKESNYVNPILLEKIVDLLTFEIMNNKNIEIYTIGSYFKNILSQDIKRTQIFPASFSHLSESSMYGKLSRGKIFEKNENLENLFLDDKIDSEETYEKIASLYFSLLLSWIWNQSNISEHALRMMAMKQAKESAKKIESVLSLKYNKTRQSAITQEIAEISSSALSMNI